MTDEKISHLYRRYLWTRYWTWKIHYLVWPQGTLPWL